MRQLVYRYAPGTKRALSEMMANNLLRLNVSPTGAHPATSSGDGGLASSTGVGPGGWHHAQGLAPGGSLTPPSCGSGGGGGGGGGGVGGGGGGWAIGSVSPRSTSLSDVWGLPLSIQAPPSPFGGLLPGGGAPAGGGGYAAAAVPGGMQASTGTQGGRGDAMAVPMSMNMSPGGGMCSSPTAHHGGRMHGEASAPGGVEFGASDEQLLTTPAKSPVSGGSGGFETTFLQSPTAPGGGTAQDMFTSQPQQQLLLRRRSALSQQLSGSLPVGLPALGTLNMPPTHFHLGAGGAAGDNSTMMPSSPSADVSPRSDLRKQAILKRASLMHATGLSPSPRNCSQGGGFTGNPSATSPTSPSSLRLLQGVSTADDAIDLMLASPAVTVAHDGKTMDDTHEFDMDTPG